MAYVEVQWGKALAPGPAAPTARQPPRPDSGNARGQCHSPAYSGTDGTRTKHDNNKHDNTKRNGNNAQQGGNDAI